MDVTDEDVRLLRLPVFRSFRPIFPHFVKCCTTRRMRFSCHPTGDAWGEAIDRVLSDMGLSRCLAGRAYAQYEGQHTWEHRARALLGTS
jgi:hypothetical protein